MSNIMSYIILFLVIVVLSQHLSRTERRCRCLSSDSSCWPNSSAWQIFNESIDGRLISPKPSATACETTPLNVDACNITRTQWSDPIWRSNQAGAMQSSNWENGSCSILPDNITCTQGSVPIYAVNATLPEHIQKTIEFVSARNLRLVIKNTGHDFLGRSTAAGSLLLWLHYMKNITLINSYSLCTGGTVSNAVRVSAGVQWGEIYTWLSSNNLIVIGGSAHTVGSAGGFLQGGGHGPLTRWQGLGADNVLEFDVVTADGQRKTVNACQNTDLFWALRGGGGGTYAVVISAVLRTYPSPSMLVSYNTFIAPNETRYISFMRDFVRLIPILADDGWSGYFYISDMSIITAFIAPNGNLTKGNETFNKFLSNNTDLQVTSAPVFSLPSFYAYFYYMQLSSPDRTGNNALLGSRLIPETIVRNQPDQLAQAFLQTRGRSLNRSSLNGHLVAGGQVSIMTNTSINPVWRTTLLHMVYVQTWPDGTSKNDQQKLTDNVRNMVNILQTVAGGDQSGCYLNEADPNEPNWQQKFFGTRQIYDRLKTIKNTVDPSGLFICKNCVGSDDWSDDLNCPKSSSHFIKRSSTIILLLIINLTLNLSLA